MPSRHLVIFAAKKSAEISSSRTEFLAAFMASLSIIIPTKDRQAIFSETLRRLIMAVGDRDIEIIVVNDSKTSTPELPENAPRVTLINNPGQGVASARNYGAAHASSGNLLFLDDDMWVSQDNIERAFTLINTYPDAAINFNWVYPDYLMQQIRDSRFGRYLERYGFTTMKGWNRGQPWDDTAVFETTGIAGASLLIKKSVFDKLGGYDASFPFAGAEDYDFTQRLKKAGVKLLIEPTSLMYQNEANKVNAESWLQRYRKASLTRKHAVDIGYSELAYNYPAFKKLIFLFLYRIRGLLHFSMRLIPPFKFADPLYFFVINLLLAAYICDGYTGNSLK
jgi:GT2 family glycosyltransferase